MIEGSKRLGGLIGTGDRISGCFGSRMGPDSWIANKTAVSADLCLADDSGDGGRDHRFKRRGTPHLRGERWKTDAAAAMAW